VVVLVDGSLLPAFCPLPSSFPSEKNPKVPLLFCGLGLEEDDAPLPTEKEDFCEPGDTGLARYSKHGE